MPTVKRRYMWVNYDFMDKGLTPIELLILSRVDEDNRFNKPCTLTNKKLSELFGETLYAVKNAISNLEKKNMITKTVQYVSGKGRGNRERRLYVNHEVAAYKKKKNKKRGDETETLEDD